jgi:RsiW-degrading membrane proteinase PrsW (M82 family)
MSSTNFRYFIFGSAAFFLVMKAVADGWLISTLSLIPTIGWLWFFLLRKQEMQPTLVTNGLLCLSAAYLVAPVFVTVGDAIRYPLLSLVGGDQLGWFVLRAGVIEEVAKFTAVYFVIRYIDPSALKHPVDGIWLAIAAALGFATYENFFHNVHLVQQTAGTGLQFFLLGALVRVPLHLLYASIWGAAFGLSKFMPAGRRRSFLLASGFGTAVFLHGFWDTIAQNMDNAAVLFLLAIIYGFLWFGHVRLVSAIKSITVMPASTPNVGAEKV